MFVSLCVCVCERESMYVCVYLDSLRACVWKRVCVKFKIVIVERSISNGPNAQIRMNPEILEEVDFYRIDVANTFLLICLFVMFTV